MARKVKKAAKPARVKKTPRPVDGVARTSGAAVGVAVLAWDSWQVAQGAIGMVTAGKVAVAALLAALAVEKFVVPVGRALIGPPSNAEEADATPDQPKR